MPMIWNAQAEARLLSAIMQVYDVKVSGAKLKEVAELMGPGCTPRALTHQLAKIRKLAKDEDAPAAGDDGGAARDAGAKAKARNKADGAAPKAKTETGRQASRPRRARAKRDYAALSNGGASDEEGEDGGEEDGLGKKVKIEVGEDIGEGLRQGVDGDGDGDEDEDEGEDEDRKMAF